MRADGSQRDLFRNCSLDYHYRMTEEFVTQNCVRSCRPDLGWNRFLAYTDHAMQGFQMWDGGQVAQYSLCLNYLGGCQMMLPGEIPYN